MTTPRAGGWLCDRCAMVTHPTSALSDLRRYVVPDPRSPDDTCGSCGDPLPEVIRIRLLLEQAARANPAASLDTAPNSPARPAPTEDLVPGKLYGLREVAARLRIDRSKTLASLIEAGSILTVNGGRGRAVVGAELARVLRVGLPSLPTSGRSPRAARARPRKGARRHMTGSIRNIPLD